MPWQNVKQRDSIGNQAHYHTMEHTKQASLSGQQVQKPNRLLPEDKAHNRLIHIRKEKRSRLGALFKTAYIECIYTETSFKTINMKTIINYQSTHRTRKVLTGQLGGIEKLESGWMVAVTYYNGFRIIIPMNEMMINLSGDGRENADTLNRQVRIANNMLGCDIDFIIKDLDTKSRSVVASRKDAMLKKRQIFYLGEEGEKPLLYPGRIAEARVIAVAPKAVRLEVFGVEVSVRARDMAWEWMLDAGEKFQVGDLVQVMVNKVEGTEPDEIHVEVDAKSPTANINKDNLRKCHRQGKYTGVITEVYKGTYFIRLDIGINAVAHSCNMSALPGKGDKIGIVVTRINDNYEVVEGIITRLIKRWK